MSLLLEALKKAEKAKEEAQRRAKTGEADGGADPEATMVDPAKHVTTRDELPDISAPLEILSEDLPGPRAKAAAPALSSLALEDLSPAPAPSAAPEPRAAPRREASRAAAESQASDRASAQKVFEAKFREPNPKLPFYITVGLLGVFAIGTGVYFWYQLRPYPALVNANPPKPAGEVVAAPSESKPVPGAPAADAAPTAQAPIPGLPGAQPPASAPVAAPAPSSSPAAPAAAAPAPVAAAPATAPVPTAAPTPVASAPSPRAPTREATREATPRSAPSPARDVMSVNRPAPQIHPRVEAGYAAYQSGDTAKARGEYEAALRDDPANRDAMLGLAAVEVRAQRFDLAEQLYQRLLQANPRDPHAQAGLLALRGSIVDPVQAESRVKTLLAGDPEASVLHFTLGNQYAQQGRWTEAQQAYFKAFAADPENPDYAFNLAVSLDQMRQSALALEYYRRALSLAERRSANFAPELARGRVQQLAR